MQVRCHDGEPGKCQGYDTLPGPSVWRPTFKHLDLLTKYVEPSWAPGMCAR
jgi:hypothetical protein